MPCTAGGTPVTIDRLLGLVKLGMTQSATKLVPAPASNPPRNGAAPAATAAVMYSNWQPSTQTTTSGRSIQRYVRPFTVMSDCKIVYSVRAAALWIRARLSTALFPAKSTSMSRNRQPPNSVEQTADDLLANGESCRGTDAAGNQDQTDPGRWRVDQHDAILGDRVGPHPAFANGRRRTADDGSVLLEQKTMDSLVGEWSGVIVMAIAHHQAAVRPLRNDEMDAVFQILTMLRFQAHAQRARLRQAREPAVTHQAQVRHQIG